MGFIFVKTGHLENIASNVLMHLTLFLGRANPHLKISPHLHNKLKPHLAPVKATPSTKIVINPNFS